MSWPARARYEPFGEPRTRRVGSCRRGGPYVSADTVRQLLEPLVEELGLPTVAALADVSARNLFGIMHGRSRVVSLDVADRLICGPLDDPSLWWTEPGLEFVKLPSRPRR